MEVILDIWESNVKIWNLYIGHSNIMHPDCQWLQGEVGEADRTIALVRLLDIWTGRPDMTIGQRDIRGTYTITSVFREHFQFNNDIILLL